MQEKQILITLIKKKETISEKEKHMNEQKII